MFQSDTQTLLAMKISCFSRAREDGEMGSKPNQDALEYLTIMSPSNMWRTYSVLKSSPTYERLRAYFRENYPNQPLTIEAVKAIAPDNSLQFLDLNRKWAVQVLDHCALNQITIVLTTMEDDEKKGLCELSKKSNYLQMALRFGNR